MIIPQAKRLNTVQEYYFSQKLEEIRSMNAAGAQVINLGIGNPDLMPVPAVINSLKNSADQVGNHGYQSYRGILALREAMAEWYKTTYDVHLQGADEILPLIGSKEGIMHISMAFLNERDKVLVPNPGYPTYAAVSQLVGAEVVSYDLSAQNGWNIDVEQLKAMDLSEVKLMWLNFPNMPTGAKGDSQILQEIIDLAKKHQFLIVNDNPYSLILNDDPTSIMHLKGAKEVVLELNSLSKSHHMAGWRMGWVCGDAAYIATILKAKSNVDSGMFLPIQHAAIEALKTSKDWHDAQNEIYRKRRKASWDLLDLLGCTYEKDQSGLFVWARIPSDQKDTKSFVDQILYEAKVFITPGFIFGTNGEGYIRISLCNEISIVASAGDRIQTSILKRSQST